MHAPFFSPRALASSLRVNFGLIVHLTRREVEARYKGSLFGLLWAVLNPIFLLAVYTFVFSVVFRARWNAGSDSKTEFALVLFGGLLVFNFFSECFNRAPALILSQANYVKRVVFPLEILPVVSVAASLFFLVVNFGVWLIFALVFRGLPPLTALLLPLTILPVVLFALGLSWLFGAMGVYLRDLGQMTGILTTVLLFVSPVFFPISALPAAYRVWVQLNPLTMVLEQVRGVLIWGTTPSAGVMTIQVVVAALAAWLGFVAFQSMREGFADVV